MFLFGLFYFLSERKIGTRERIAFLNYYSSLISDMNVDYRDKKIAPENIRNISTSISNFTSQVEKLTPLAKNSERETQKWFIWLIDEFQTALSLWNYLWYWIGKWYGVELIEKYGDWFWLGKTEADILHKQLEKNGFWYVVLGKFHNFTRAFIPFIAGSSGMSEDKFWWYNMVGSIIWAITINLLGIYFIDNWLKFFRIGSLYKKFIIKIGVFKETKKLQ